MLLLGGMSMFFKLFFLFKMKNKKSVFMFNMEMFLHNRDSFVYYKVDLY